ncbi:hypothetical protein WBG06_25695 [Nocardioides sp. CCNWLW239]|uniref:hypothetical protein n=1 Tax=Nocardioides sp. CCNWLW239 TaxID=3128902 RepID=UPI0030180A85
MPVLTLVHDPDAAWLPEGGVAEVVLADSGEEMPGPVGLVRLQITDDAGRIFCMARSGGRPGWDLPTALVGSADPVVVIDDLTVAVFGTQQPVVLVGAVRNVSLAEGDYEWPSPVAYFCVYRPTTSSPPVVEGVWLTPVEAAVELYERHWWPLVTVDADAVRELSEELQIAWGYWLDGTDRDRVRVVDSAVEALVVGLDSPSLRELAGVDKDASWGEIDNLILRIVDELGVPHPTEESSLRLDLRRRSAKVLVGEVEPIDLAAWGHRRVGHDGPADLRALTLLDEEYTFLEEVVPYWVVEDRPAQMEALDRVVRDLAAAVVEGETDLSRFVPERWVTDAARTVGTAKPSPLSRVLKRCRLWGRNDA